jgi:hypothetical protein
MEARPHEVGGCSTRRRERARWRGGPEQSGSGGRRAVARRGSEHGVGAAPGGRPRAAGRHWSKGGAGTGRLGADPGGARVQAHASRHGGSGGAERVAPGGVAAPGNGAGVGRAVPSERGRLRHAGSAQACARVEQQERRWSGAQELARVRAGGTARR